MRSFRALGHAIFVVVVVALGVLRLDSGAFAQVEALSATPPLIEEVSRLVSKHFYDRETVERVWAQARAAHTAALPPDATSEEVAAALDAMLDDWVPPIPSTTCLASSPIRAARRLRSRRVRPAPANPLPKGRIAYTGVGVVPRTLAGRVFLAAVYHGGPAERAGLLVGDEIVSADGKPFDPDGTRSKTRRASRSASEVSARRGRSDLPGGGGARRIEPNESFLSAMRARPCASSSAKVERWAASGSGPMHDASITTSSIEEVAEGQFEGCSTKLRARPPSRLGWRTTRVHGAVRG